MISVCAPQVSNLLFSDLESDSDANDFTHGFILALLFTNLDSDTILDRFLTIVDINLWYLYLYRYPGTMLGSYYSYIHSLSSVI